LAYRKPIKRDQEVCIITMKALKLIEIDSNNKIK